MVILIDDIRSEKTHVSKFQLNEPAETKGYDYEMILVIGTLKEFVKYSEDFPSKISGI